MDLRDSGLAKGFGEFMTHDRNSENSGNSDEAPLPLTGDMPPSEPYPLDALGPILSDLARVLHQSVQAPDGICAQSVLAATALSVQGHANINIDGREFPVSENFLTIANSGERKSAIDKFVLSPHRKYEKNKEQQYHHDLKDYRLKFYAHKSAKEFLSRKAKSYEDKLQVLRDLGEEPLPPLNPIFTIEEPTYEGMIKCFETGQPSMGLFSDEGGRLLGGHGMSEDNQLKMITGLSQSWDGKPISRSRAGEGTYNIYGKRLSVHLMLQPEIARQMISNEMFQGQGFLARFLYSWPTPLAGFRPYQSKEIPSEKSFQQYESKTLEILNFSLPLLDGTRNELKPRSLILSPKVKQLWIMSHDSIEAQLSDGHSLSSIRSFASKAPEHLLRLAGILALFDDIEANEIKSTHIEAGIALINYYLSESLRITSASPDSSLTSARVLIQWLHKQGLEFVYLNKIMQYGPNSLRKKENAEKTIQTLVDHRWLIPIKNGRVIDGSFRKYAWRVHP